MTETTGALHFRLSSYANPSAGRVTRVQPLTTWKLGGRVPLGTRPFVVRGASSAWEWRRHPAASFDTLGCTAAVNNGMQGVVSSATWRRRLCGLAGDTWLRHPAHPSPTDLRRGLCASVEARRGLVRHTRPCAGDQLYRSVASTSRTDLSSSTWNSTRPPVVAYAW